MEMASSATEQCHAVRRAAGVARRSSAAAAYLPFSLFSALFCLSLQMERDRADMVESCTSLARENQGRGERDCPQP